jgi:predicted dehydrogenase
VESRARSGIAVGFGRYLRERVLARLMDADPDLLTLDAVTELRNGREEFDDLVVPFFASRGIRTPDYVPDLEDAIDATGSHGSTPPVAIINTPTGLHAGQAATCIAGGLDVYVERPLGTHNDDVPGLVRAAEKAGLIIFTGSQRRAEAPFRYVHDAVVGRRDFADIASIRCTLATGQRPNGWRADSKLAGGGILTDSGFHLLDCAAWLASGAGHAFEDNSVRYLYLQGGEGGGLESTAVGHIRSPTGLDLFFDLSYTTPMNSVYERLEVNDRDGARLALVRDQAVRSSAPGRVTHQRQDGSIVASKVGSDYVVLEAAELSRDSNVAGPLRSFLRAREGGPGPEHPCSGQSHVASWKLIKEIYGFARSTVD